jgi:hypothetical protein
MATRLKVWHKVAADWKLPHLDRLTSETSLEGLNEKIELMLNRQHRGRTIVKLPD